MLDAEQVGGIGALRLESDGRSTYRDLEAGFHVSHSSRFDLTASYSRSLAEGDLNAFATYFDTMLWPVVPPRSYGPLPTDVPHRFLARGRLLPAATWLIIAVADWRTGLPYSLVDAALDFVGPRNEERMPNYLALRSGPRAPLQDLQAATVDRRARLQRVQRVSSRRRAGEHLVAGLRISLQLPVQAVSDCRCASSADRAQ